MKTLVHRARLGLLIPALTRHFLCERALKRAILHRKNALFYKTPRGAEVGDLFMSIFHTCELNGVNSFRYLTALQENLADLAANPGHWMPWNFPQQGRAPPPS